MKQKTTIIVALAAVAVAGLAVAAKMRAVVPSVQVVSGASATIAVTGAASVSQPANHSANDFPATVSQGAPQSFALSKTGQVLYTQGNGAPCSYIIANAGSGNLSITTSGATGQLKCDVSGGGSGGQVTFSISSSSA